MKNLIILLILSTTVFGLWLSSKYWVFLRSDYISEKTLEMAMPINVKIDVELINSLSPAYER